MTERMLTLTLTGFSPKGFEISLQVLDVAIDKLADAIPWLDGHAEMVGIRPVCGVVDKNGSTQATDAEFPICPIHNVAMQCHTKGKAHWFSHKVADADGRETWCRGK